MTDIRETGTLARAVFAGLLPSPRVDGESDGQASGGALALPRAQGQSTPGSGSGIRNTGAVMLAGAMTVALSLTGPLDASSLHAKRTKPQAPTEAEAQAPDRQSVAAAVAAAREVPATYTVKAGDTISAIAARYGLSTASVLTLNGLSWKSLIFPGQVLKLKKSATTKSTVSAPKAPAASTGTSSYTVKSGDTISAIAKRFGVAVQKVLDANKLKWTSIIYPGQKITIPSGSSAPAAAPAPIQVEEIANASPSAAPYFHLVKSGDTLSAIAKSYGVTLNAVLDANGLRISSIIYPGQRILIPGKTGSNGDVTVLTSEQATNARIIINVGRALGVPDRGIVIALAAAMQESSLRNIPYGDRDSVGLFQQRPSVGWGQISDLLNPEHAARLFYGGPSNPNKGKTAGLLDIKNWQSMTVTQAAQAVQVSAYPDAYAKWETSAWAWLSQLG